MSLRALSLCSGIEAASVAASPLGWRFVAFSEIEAFPSAVLAHHYPDVPNHGDMLAADWSVYRGHVDIVVGGTPCQAFSVAGLRGGLTDARGNLTMQFVKACDDIEPAYVLWENVPGVLSDRANAFGCFLGALCGESDRLEPPGGRWLDAGYVLGPTRAIAWRILDAQYFGLAQRRRRVFVVACPVDGNRLRSDPRQILFECDGVRRDLAPSRETGASVAGSLKAGAGRNGADDNDAKANRIVASTLEATAGASRGAGTPPSLLAVAFGGNRTSGPTDVAAAVNAHGGGDGQTMLSLKTGGGKAGQSYPAIATDMRVRRLTPLECERLQGFPDDYTLIPLPMKRRQTRQRWSSDGSRYKALGNSWAVPCVRWIFARITVDWLVGE